MVERIPENRRINRVSQARREDPFAQTVEFHLEDAGAPNLPVQSVLVGIAGQADRHVELASVAARQNVARPVIVVAAGRQRPDHFAWVFDRGLTNLVREAHYAVGVGDKKRVSTRAMPRG